jgi:hypothetical protein
MRFFAMMADDSPSFVLLPTLSNLPSRRNANAGTSANPVVVIEKERCLSWSNDITVKTLLQLAQCPIEFQPQKSATQEQPNSSNTAG